VSDWNFLNAHRFHHSSYPRTDASWGFNGVFQFGLSGDPHSIRCIASDGGGWQHVSVSYWQKPRRVPSWELMCRIKDLFWDKTDTVVQYHPAESDYVNMHPGCLHLWRPTEAILPVPPPMMIGIPGVKLKTTT
jgi:hypothetical protein